jgi:hypothetical protein
LGVYKVKYFLIFIFFLVGQQGLAKPNPVIRYCHSVFQSVKGDPEKNAVLTFELSSHLPADEEKLYEALGSNVTVMGSLAADVVSSNTGISFRRALVLIGIFKSQNGRLPTPLEITNELLYRSTSDGSNKIKSPRPLTVAPVVETQASKNLNSADPDQHNLVSGDSKFELQLTSENRFQLFDRQSRTIITTIESLTSNAVGNIVWSPENKYVKLDERFGASIYIVATDGSKTLVVKGDHHHPQAKWISPSELAVTFDGGFYILNVATNKKVFDSTPYYSTREFTKLEQLQALLMGRTLPALRQGEDNLIAMGRSGYGSADLIAVNSSRKQLLRPIDLTVLEVRSLPITSEDPEKTKNINVTTFINKTGVQLGISRFTDQGSEDITGIQILPASNSDHFYVMYTLAGKWTMYAAVEGMYRSGRQVVLDVDPQTLKVQVMTEFTQPEITIGWEIRSGYSYATFEGVPYKNVHMAESADGRKLQLRGTKNDIVQVLKDLPLK